MLLWLLVYVWCCHGHFRLCSKIEIERSKVCKLEIHVRNEKKSNKEWSRETFGKKEE